ncbi:MAG: hypothetical protein NC485_15030 [Ruminococcus flavefaciens]|nr:hypothetical protein [Ruminococcus flavefaciens]
MKVLTLLMSIIEDEYKDIFEIDGSVYASIPTETIHSILKPLLTIKGLNNIISDDTTDSIIFEGNNISILVCSKTKAITINITEEVRQVSELPEIHSIYILMVNAIKRMADKE